MLVYRLRNSALNRSKHDLQTLHTQPYNHDHPFQYDSKNFLAIFHSPQDSLRVPNYIELWAYKYKMRGWKRRTYWHQNHSWPTIYWLSKEKERIWLERDNLHIIFLPLHISNMTNRSRWKHTHFASGLFFFFLPFFLLSCSSSSELSTGTTRAFVMTSVSQKFSHEIRQAWPRKQDVPTWYTSFTGFFTLLFPINRLTWMNQSLVML